MARGGRRSGTVGTVYGQRTDLNVKRNLDTGYTPSAAPATPSTPPAGAASPAQPPPGQEETGIHPDQVTPLFAPTDRPNEPVTAGLPYGPGPGPAPDTNSQDLLAMRRHIPWLAKAAQRPDTPISVVNFLSYLQSRTNGTQ